MFSRFTSMPPAAVGGVGIKIWRSNKTWPVGSFCFSNCLLLTVKSTHPTGLTDRQTDRDLLIIRVGLGWPSYARGQEPRLAFQSAEQKLSVRMSLLSKQELKICWGNISHFFIAKYFCFKSSINSLFDYNSLDYALWRNITLPGRLWPSSGRLYSWL